MHVYISLKAETHFSIFLYSTHESGNVETPTLSNYSRIKLHRKLNKAFVLYVAYKPLLQALGKQSVFGFF